MAGGRLGACVTGPVIIPSKGDREPSQPSVKGRQKDSTGSQKDYSRRAMSVALLLGADPRSFAICQVERVATTYEELQCDNFTSYSPVDPGRDQLHNFQQCQDGGMAYVACTSASDLNVLQLLASRFLTWSGSANTSLQREVLSVMLAASGIHGDFILIIAVQGQLCLLSRLDGTLSSDPDPLSFPRPGLVVPRGFGRLRGPGPVQLMDQPYRVLMERAASEWVESVSVLNCLGACAATIDACAPNSCLLVLYQTAASSGFVRSKEASPSTSDSTAPTANIGATGGTPPIPGAAGVTADFQAAPKKPRGYISNFNFFARERRSEVKAAYPDLNPNMINAKLGEMWKVLPEEERTKYDAMAAQDKLRYLREHSQMDSNGREPPRINPPSDVRGRVALSTSNRTKSAYSVFCRQETLWYRGRYNQDQQKMKQISSHFSEKWASVSTEDREIFGTVATVNKIMKDAASAASAAAPAETAECAAQAGTPAGPSSPAIVAHEDPSDDV